jgi:hypothetical protein
MLDLNLINAGLEPDIYLGAAASAPAAAAAPPSPAAPAAASADSAADSASKIQTYSLWLKRWIVTGALQVTKLIDK